MWLFISGSAPLRSETHQDWLDWAGRAIFERYRMTGANIVTSNPYAGDSVSGSMGRPLPGVGLRVVDRETGCELPMNEVVGMIANRYCVCKASSEELKQKVVTDYGAHLHSRRMHYRDHHTTTPSDKTRRFIVRQKLHRQIGASA